MSLQNKRIKIALAMTMIRLRGLQGINQAELAIRSGLTRQYISMVERQERSPNILTLMKLCVGLNVNESFFFLALYDIISTMPPESADTYCEIGVRSMMAAERPQATQEKRVVDARCWDA